MSVLVDKLTSKNTSIVDNAAVTDDNVAPVQTSVNQSSRRTFQRPPPLMRQNVQPSGPSQNQPRQSYQPSRFTGQWPSQPTTSLLITHSNARDNVSNSSVRDSRRLSMDGNNQFSSNNFHNLLQTVVIAYNNTTQANVPLTVKSVFIVKSTIISVKHVDSANVPCDNNVNFLINRVSACLHT